MNKLCPNVKFNTWRIQYVCSFVFVCWLYLGVFSRGETTTTTTTTTTNRILLFFFHPTHHHLVTEKIKHTWHFFFSNVYYNESRLRRWWWRGRRKNREKKEATGKQQIRHRDKHTRTKYKIVHTSEWKKKAYMTSQFSNIYFLIEHIVVFSSLII